jgi:hypothetical protein
MAKGGTREWRATSVRMTSLPHVYAYVMRSDASQDRKVPYDVSGGASGPYKVVYRSSASPPLAPMTPNPLAEKLARQLGH